MKSSAQWLTHTFAGGWATDFGTTFYGGPGQDGSMRIPFLVTAQNLVYELDGGPHKAPGTNKLNSAALESGASIMGIYDYWRQGVSGAPAQKRVIHVGTTIKKDDADGNFTNIFTGLESGVVPWYETFDDLLIISSSSTADVPRSWDQTTAQNLAGSPPRFSFCVKHKNRLFAAGNYAVPSRLYYSVSLDPEDWASLGSGSIDVDPSDGDMITGLASYKGELIVFKGPNKGSIHRLAGSSSADFAMAPVVTTGLGACWISSIFRFGDDVGFMSPRGTAHSLQATAAFGDIQQSYLSFPINTYLRTALNHSRNKFWWAVNDPANGYVLLALSRAGVSRNDVILIMDYRFKLAGEQFPRWAYWDTFSAQGMAYCLDTSFRPRMFFGSNDGFVYRGDQVTRSHSGTSISMDAKTCHFTYGSELMMKTLGGPVAIGLAPKNQNAVTFGWTRDNNAEETQTVTQGGADVLGPATVNPFTLDSSRLGGALYVPRFLELEGGGEFRSVQYRVADNTEGSDLEVHSLGAMVTPGADSTENT